MDRSRPSKEDSRSANHNLLLNAIKAKLPELEILLNKVNDHWCYEDMVYRFYHHSYKVYWVQQTTQEIVRALEALAPPGQSFLGVMHVYLRENNATIGEKMQSHRCISDRQIGTAVTHCSKIVLKKQKSFSIVITKPQLELPKCFFQFLVPV